MTFALFITMFSLSNAQEIEWQNTIGGSRADELYTLERTSDGGYIIGGFSNSGISGDKTDPNISTGSSTYSADYWILKIDATGNIQWQNTIGGSGGDFLVSIRQTFDGGYILGGHSSSNSSGDKTENAMGPWDYWIVKTDEVGNVQWENTIGGSDADLLYTLEQTNDGGYILGGISNSGISGDKTVNNPGWFNYWLIKTDSMGNLQWQKVIGGNAVDDLASVKQTTDGGFILAGRSTSNAFGDKVENSNGSYDFWIVKTDSIGNIQWQNTIGGSGADMLFAIQQTFDGGYILGGYSDSNASGDKLENSLGGWDYWIVKIDVVGNIEWQNTIGGISYDYLESVEQTADGGYILGGYSNSNISGDKTENSLGVYDYWIVKVDTTGNIQWQQTFGGGDEDNLFSLETTTDGGYILGGRSNSNISGDKTENSMGLQDYWILKITDKYNQIQGSCFLDFNSNNIQDTGESILSNQKIIEQNTGKFAFSDQNGNYTIFVFDSGNYVVSPQVLNWYTPMPSFQTAAFSAIHQIDSLNDFAFQPQGAFEDVGVTITPMGTFRSGSMASYMINYGNYGTTTVSPIVYLYPSSNVTYQSATLAPSNITTNSVVWNLPSLTPFQTGSIIVTVNVNLGHPVGTLINSNAHIEPYLTDDNPSNNNSNWAVYIAGSFDPNDILVNEDTLTTTQVSAAPWLDYIIRFQNTGNDTAFTVKILNPIDTNKLNIYTIEFVSASHQVSLHWINFYKSYMEFKFENILLPDSNTNEPLSHGFVRYRIQPKTTLTAGDSITNFAAISFDFNEPVITNTAKTIIILPTGIASASPTQEKLHVFPNPAENTINISGIQLENGKAQLRLMDIYGKIILEKTVTTTASSIETIQLANGVYLIQSGGRRATFIKQ
ncbi:MAG: T9SS type A sorting domain-containing protein [Bacteroidia bacterium]|nr:T9SS type A sorting domain-containing protein [Bacteroidia bacterium]